MQIDPFKADFYLGDRIYHFGRRWFFVYVYTVAFRPTVGQRRSQQLFMGEITGNLIHHTRTIQELITSFRTIEFCPIKSVKAIFGKIWQI